MKIKIYKLIDPLTNEIRYIGQTSQELKTRLRQHINKSKSGSKSYKSKWIRKLLLLNEKPNIELIEYVNESEVSVREKYWINEYKNENLTNGTEGGEFAVRGSKLSKHARNILSENGKKRTGDNNPMWGKKHNINSKKLMSEKKIGVYDGEDNPRARKIYDYGENGELFKVWNTGKEVADFYEISKGNVSTVAKFNTILSGEMNEFNESKIKLKEDFIKHIKSDLDVTDEYLLTFFNEFNSNFDKKFKKLKKRIFKYESI